jgi:DNA polymerase-3 subunit gamma/tau
MLGARPFSAEIAASAAASLRDSGSAAAELLFIRSVRKLLARFSPVLWEDNQRKLRDLAPLTGQLEESLNDLESLGGEGEEGAPARRKIHDALVKAACKLESEGVGELILIDHIRRAAYWGRLAPTGRRKVLLIENAERMKDEARNSLLKILEEPPDTLTIVLTSARPRALLPTILSRLRSYRFVRREPAVEAAVIRRIFRDPGGEAPSNGREAASQSGAAFLDGGGEGGIQSYLDSFLPVSGETLHSLAAFFAASVAKTALLARRRRGLSGLPGELVLLGKHCSPLAGAAGWGRPLGDSEGMIALVLKGADNFEVRSLFPRFLNRLLALVSESLRSPELPPSAPPPRYYDIWRQAVAEAERAVGVGAYQSPALALERLGTELAAALAEPRYGPLSGGGRR